MQDLARVFAARGGFAQRRNFLAAGFSGRDLTRLVATGKIQRVRIGWYVDRFADRWMVESARVGGCLACVSAASRLGLWTPPEHALHILVPSNGSRFRSRTRASVRFDRGRPAHTVLHWETRPGAVDRPIVDLRRCLQQVMDCLPADMAIAILDSALNQRKLSISQLRAIGGGGSQRQRELIDCTDGRSASGLESLSRVRLLMVGLSVRVQVEVLHGIRVDLLIDGWLVIELDGEEFHGNAVGFERDRVRDAPLNAWGFRVLHFSRSQVLDDWSSVESTILLVVLRHRGQ